MWTQQTALPPVKATVSSGYYANDPIMVNYKQYGFVGVAPKPYKIEDVSKVLRGLLQSS